MVQGTASSVGKSVITAALCRILRQDGWSVAPFKSQNMSLNSFVTSSGGEMGRAQVVQAEAAGVEPTVDMNPILLKPESDNRSQVVVRGKPLRRLSARAYDAQKPRLWSVVTAALARLRRAHEIIIIEGAGSPAEINLRDTDLVNMRVARHCQAPVMLVGDIDRGGVFASLVGTLELLEPEERALVRGMIINKFRGDFSLLEPGLTWLEARTDLPVAGVIPYDHDLRIAEEDSMALEQRRRLKTQPTFLLDLAVIGLPHLSNFDEFAPLEQEDGVRLRYVEAGDVLGCPDAIILPGTKSTLDDLAYLKRTGLAQEIVAQARQGRPVIGICGGYQMLGESLRDPNRREGRRSQAVGLGLLPVATTFRAVKSTHQVKARVVSGRGLLRRARGLLVVGYEIHMGRSRGAYITAPFQVTERSRRPCEDSDGCISLAGNVLGTYIHGLFHNAPVRRAILRELAARRGRRLPANGAVRSQDEAYDHLATLVRSHLDMGLVYRLLGLPPPHGARRRSSSTRPIWSPRCGK